MHPNLLTWLFTGLFVFTFIGWWVERQPTALYVTIAESLGLFLLTRANGNPLGCAPSPEPRDLGNCIAGKLPLTFDFGEKRLLCVVLEVPGVKGKRKRLDLTLKPAENADALHVTLSADGLPPIFEREVPFAAATKENPFALGQP